MKRCTLLIVVFALIVAVLASQSSAQALRSVDGEKSELEKEISRLSLMVANLSWRIEKIQMADENAAVIYNCERTTLAFMRFRQLKSFDGKLIKYEIFEPSDGDPQMLTFRVFIERESDGKSIIIDNFETFSKSKERLDLLIKQNKCTFPYDIYKLRHTVGVD